MKEARHKRVHIPYKILQNANLLIVTESRSEVVWAWRLGELVAGSREDEGGRREELQRHMKKFWGGRYIQYIDCSEVLQCYIS